MPMGSTYVLPKTITAEAGHLNMSLVQVVMEEKAKIRASSTYLGMSVEKMSQTVDK